ncbi:UDP-N-acetylmuramoyl-tripeptide--D-alanyl-D-alanine ligase [Oscillatoria amoena NRMC-F 0135]|nr:UDP-N-acetylmuramoyl-tripeptide--D-alanyl-D-alanine ligase [Oscillatoria amoena NRMC-F 0135]
MDALTFSEAAAFCGGTLSGAGAGASFAGVSTDTRRIAPGSLFVALKGDRFDAHDFLDEAIRSGVAGVVVRRGSRPALSGQIARIEADDTLAALQQIARGYRGKLPVRTVAITGSNGKTSTKEFTAAVLSKQFATHKTQGNLNNHIGVPLTILQLDSHHGAAVIEMGMNHAGELAPLVQIAQPSVGIVTNVGPVHIENFPDERGIAEEKATVARGIPAIGTAIINRDDKWFDVVSRDVRAPVLTFAIDDSSATLRASGISVSREGIRYKLHHEGRAYEAFSPVSGEHMVYNAMAGALAGVALGMQWDAILAGLAEVKLPGMRMQQSQIHGVHVINDAYNANPVSMVAGLKTLKALAGGGTTHAVVGTMYELGALAEDAHAQVGREAARLGISRVYALGEYAGQIAQGARESGIPARHVYSPESPRQAAEILKQQCQPGDHVLIKGSRGAKMEEVLAAWQELG